MGENDNRNCLPGNYSRNACKCLSLWSWAGLFFSGNTRAAADHQCPELPSTSSCPLPDVAGGLSHRRRKLQRESEDDSVGRSPTSRDWQCKNTNKPTLGQEPEHSFYRTAKGYWSSAGYEGDVLVEKAPEHALQCKAGITGKSKTRLKKKCICWLSSTCITVALSLASFSLQGSFYNRLGSRNHLFVLYFIKRMGSKDRHELHKAFRFIQTTEF